MHTGYILLAPRRAGSWHSQQVPCTAAHAHAKAGKKEIKERANQHKQQQQQQEQPATNAEQKKRRIKERDRHTKQQVLAAGEGAQPGDSSTPPRPALLLLGYSSVAHRVVAAPLEVHLALKRRPHRLQCRIVCLLLGGLDAWGCRHLQHIVPVALHNAARHSTAQYSIAIAMRTMGDSTNHKPRQAVTCPVMPARL